MKLSPWSIAIALVLLAVCCLAVWHRLDEHMSFANPYPYDIQRVTLDGHLYYKQSQGGLVHSEACPCKNLTNQ